MADSTPRTFTRRTFLGWWMASLLTATVAIGLAPILVFLWPAPAKGQKKTKLAVTLATPIEQLSNGNAIKFDAPTSPNSAFVMADGGGDNAAGDLAFGGFAVPDLPGEVKQFEVHCSHPCSLVALY